jgi:hypothetical protein
MYSITSHLAAGAHRDDYFGKNMQRGWARKVISVTNNSGGQRGPVRKSWVFEIIMVLRVTHCNGERCVEVGKDPMQWWALVWAVLKLKVLEMTFLI